MSNTNQNRSKIVNELLADLDRETTQNFIKSTWGKSTRDLGDNGFFKLPIAPDVHLTLEQPPQVNPSDDLSQRLENTPILQI